MKKNKTIQRLPWYDPPGPMKRKKDMMQTANAIIIQPVKDEMSGKTPVKKSKKCPAIKTTTFFLKQNIKNNKRKAVAQKTL
ncbi:hypothetical protein [Peribacillus frigoritolerans]|uniref:Uncharacterized protein n=1 Tax=Peribacillus castrilensis TaxID=2897690 RepID=A0AAW9NAL3_9BACI|nr:hypothetical protein [Peribacillus castrilensis]